MGSGDEWLSAFIDLTGQKFNMLTAKRYVGIDRQKCSLYECLCDCGRTVICRGSSLVNGHTKSCGHHRAKFATEEDKKDRLFVIWRNMIARCYKQTDPAYPRYGGRGIRVCDDWRNSYYAFRDWATNNGYDKSLTIDRINNDGNYEPVNCRWATRYIQNNNSSRNRWIEFNGECMTLSQWARRLGIDPAALSFRLKNWPIDKALTARKFEKVILS